MRPSLLVLLATLVAIFLLAGLIGGKDFAPDGNLVAQLGLWRIDSPPLASLLVFVTHLGGSFVLVPLALVAGAWLWVKGKRTNGLLLVATTLSGRAAIELIKLVVDRPRPSFEPFPVYVSSQSFPSGHAGNSMVTYLALALFALPERWRIEGLVAGAALAIAIGATRPALGVHWPTDVIAGWCFGALWVWLWAAVSQRQLRSA
jgi:membrane-associated phospholipid phosphatase